MAVKRILLLASAALIAIGIAAPAAAQAGGYWWFDHEINGSPTTEEPKEVAPTGDLTLTTLGFRFGPCEDVAMQGTLYNNAPNGWGEGTFENTLAQGEDCGTSLPGCKVEKSTFLGMPWQIDLNFEKEAEISGIEIETHLSANCEEYALPLTSTASGSVAAEFTDYVPPKGEIKAVPATVVFKETPGLMVGGVIPVYIDGTIKFGTKFTAEFKM